MTVGELKKLLDEYLDPTEVILMVDGEVVDIDGVYDYSYEESVAAAITAH